MTNARLREPTVAGGRLIVAGFHGKTPPPELEAAVRAGEVGGVIYFARNIESPDQVAAMSAQLQALAPWPLFIAIDQEGGAVQRLRAPFTVFPPMAHVGGENNEALAESVGRVLGRELRTVGVNWNYAPVLDVDTNPANPVIGARAFGRSSEQVARLGVALAKGLEAEGVLSCGKHFPGHGDTHEDSHHTLPVLRHALERLREVELPPFAAYARAGLASVMTAHVLFPALDPVRPATLSPQLLCILRDELRFEGLIVSDDLEMKAVADHHAVEEMVELGLAAGVDVFLVCHDLSRVRRASETVRRLARTSEELSARISASLARVDEACTRFALPHPVPDAATRASVLGCPAHAQVRAQLAGPVAARLVDPTERSAS